MKIPTPTGKELKGTIVAKQRLYATIMKDNSRSPELEKLSIDIGKLTLKIYAGKK